MSNHHDIVLGSNANDRIGLDSQSRVRVDRDGNRSCEHFRLTTGSGLSNRYCIIVYRNIAVNRNRRISVGSTRSIRDDFTVTIPSVNFTTGNTTGNVSGQGELSTFAQNITIGQVSSNRVNNRDIVHHDGDRIVSSTDRVLVGIIVQEVDNLNDIVGSNVRSECLELMSVTRENMVEVQLILIPLEGEFSLIVVIQVSSYVNRTALADLSLGSSNVNIRNIVNVNLERLAE